jgi:hypothetical protein
MRRFGLIAWFRLMLWWGVQSMKRLMRMPEGHSIEESSRTHSPWPEACWLFGEERSACLAFDSDAKEIRIVVSKMSIN